MMENKEAMNNDILVLGGLTIGQKVKLTRIAKGLRQIDVASAARVDCIDITRLEKAAMYYLRAASGY